MVRFAPRADLEFPKRDVALGERVVSALNDNYTLRFALVNNRPVADAIAARNRVLVHMAVAKCQCRLFIVRRRRCRHRCVAQQLAWRFVHALVVDIVLGMEALQLSVYVLLWIIDWLPHQNRVHTSYRKVKLIGAVLASIQRVRERRLDTQRVQQ